jgi:chromosome segregation ATPase
MTQPTIPADVRELQSVNDRIFALEGQKVGLLIKREEAIKELADLQTALTNLGPQLINGHAGQAETEAPRLRERIQNVELRLTTIDKATVELDGKTVPLRQEAERLDALIGRRKRQEELAERRDTAAKLRTRAARLQLEADAARIAADDADAVVKHMEQEDRDSTWNAQRRQAAERFRTVNPRAPGYERVRAGF